VRFKGDAIANSNCYPSPQNVTAALRSTFARAQMWRPEVVLFTVLFTVLLSFFVGKRRAPKRGASLVPYGEACRPLFALDFKACAGHLNHGSYGCAPHAIMAAAHREMLKVEAWPDRFMRRTALATFGEAADVLGAALLRAPKGSVAFVENATAGVNAVLRSLRLQKGDVIIITRRALMGPPLSSPTPPPPPTPLSTPSLPPLCADTYNACKNAVLDVAQRSGATVVTHEVPLPLAPGGAGGGGTLADGLVEAWDALLASQAPGSVKFALVDHITSPTAILMPVARLVGALRARHPGARVMVDGAHAPGHVAALDVPSLGADWYVGNLHKWCWTLKGVALLHAGDAVRGDTQGGIISHWWQLSFLERFFMQGTLDYSRYLSAPAVLAWVEEALGGWESVHAHNAALAREGAAVLAAAWGGAPHLLEPAARVEAEGLRAPFLAAVVTPLQWRTWVVRQGGAQGVWGLPEGEALAAMDADAGLNERMANAVLAEANIQSVFFPWRVGGATVVANRISANVYNTLEEYERLAAAVLRVHARAEAQFGQAAAAARGGAA
jgi:isopenicillin-N epimerase